MSHPGLAEAAALEDYQYRYDAIDIGIDEFLSSTPVRSCILSDLSVD